MTKLPITILIIEDERILRESLADYLEDRDFRTLTAENGRAGLEVFDQEHPDVVLTDLRMPEMGGLEVLERIGVQSPNIPLIVVSGTGHLGDAVRALRLGAWDYIVKPIDDMDIIGYTIDKVLERARLLQESSDHQEHLEVEVQKRTAELGEANAHLAGINERLRKLVESTHSLSMCDRVDTFGFKLLDEFANHMLATGGSIYLIEEDGLRRLSTLDGDHTSEFIHFPLPVGSVILRVMETKEALLVQDIAQEEDLKPSGWKGYRDQSLLVFPLPDESGSIVGVLTLHNKISPPFIKQDIDVGAILASYCSEMMRAIHATESLRESERHYYSLLNAMSEQILVVNSDLCITGANASAVQAAGEDSEEFLIGKSYHKVAHGRDNPCADTGECCKLEAVFKTGIPCAFRHASRKSGHSDEYMDIVVTPLKDDKGDVLRVIVCARDITKEVTLEEQFRQAQKMDAVGQLAGGVAHDFNNLLQVILGYGDLALDDVEEGSSVRESLDEILEAGNRARILVSQLLAFSRRQVLDMEDLDINSVISDTLKMLRRLIGEHIHLDFLSGQELDTIRADLGQIGQILTNLCINARDAMPSGGTITIETENISLDEAYCLDHLWAKSGRYVLLSMTDTGCGMDEETLARIFEPFFTTKEVGKGTGLGLSTIYGSVKQHKGMVQVYSEVGKGTVFKIYLPVVDRSVVSEDRKIEDKVLRGTETILLAEDEKMVRTLSAAILEQNGYTVLLACDGEEAIDIFEHYGENIDMLLLDVVMPKVGGRAVHDRIRKIRPDVRVLYVSGYSMDALHTDFILDDGMILLSKPYRRNDLLRRVREVLDKE